MKPVQGEPWPVERAFHAACCLNYSEDHPQLLVYGGLDNYNKTLGGMWILDVDTGKWAEVSFSQRYSSFCCRFRYQSHSLLHWPPLRR